jgi:hypothetical protein
VAVILVILDRVLPLVILITVPFVEEISPSGENAAKVFGDNSFQLFTRVLVPRDRRDDRVPQCYRPDRPGHQPPILQQRDGVHQ